MNNNWYNPYAGGGPPFINYYDNEPNNVVAQSRHFYSNYERPRSYEEFRRDYDERHSARDDYSMPWEQDGWGKSFILLERSILIFRMATHNLDQWS